MAAGKEQAVPAQWRDRLEYTETQLVHRWRYSAAATAGLSPEESLQFAIGDADLDRFRRAAARGCTPAQLVDIFL